MQSRLPNVPFASALFLRDFAKLFIVQENMGDVHTVFHSCREIHRILTKSAIPGNRNNLPSFEGFKILRCSPGPHPRWKAKTNRPEISRHQNTLASFRLQIPTKAIGIITDIDGENRILRRQLAESCKYRGAVNALAALLF